MKSQIQNLLESYQSIKPQIEHRLSEFINLRETAADEILFKELIFCLLTPQSNAERCWMAVQQLEKRNLFYSDDPIKISECLRGYTRFHHTKAKNILRNKEFLSKNNKICIRERLNKIDNPLKMREWLVENIIGMGYKEASHFLRNIGLGLKLAILDRHILRKLIEFKVITNIPNSLPVKTYLSIEQKMRKFSQERNMPLSHLDFLLWFTTKKTIFK